MSLPVYQNTIVNDRGDVLPEALLRVRTDPGQSNVTLYKDRDAADVLTNVGDVYADTEGFVRFYLPPGVYRMHVVASGYERTYRHVQVAPLNEYNVVSAEQYALAITDAGNNIQFISDNPVSVEIPTDEDVEFPMWSEVTLIQAGDGIITLSGDVTIQNPSGEPVKSMGKGSSIKLTLIGGNVWLARVTFDRIIDGDIEQTGDLKITGSITHQGNSTQTGNAQITGRLDVDNIRIDGNTVSSRNTNGHVEITPNGSGRVRLNKNTDITGNVAHTGNYTQTGTQTVTGQLNVDNLRMDGNVLSSTNSNGHIDITPAGSGKVRLNKSTAVAGDFEASGDTVLHGNLHVKGTTTIVDSTEVDIGDNIIRLNANETGQPTLSAGFEVERGLQANVSFLWDEFNKRWTTGTQKLHSAGFVGDGSEITNILWGNVSGKPATATRWPAFAEVTGKPSTYPPSSHTHPASQISDSTSVGRAVLTAADAAAARAAIDAVGGAGAGDLKAMAFLDKATQAEQLDGDSDSVGTTPLGVKRYVDQFGLGRSAALNLSEFTSTTPPGFYRILSGVSGAPNGGAFIVGAYDGTPSRRGVLIDGSGGLYSASVAGSGPVVWRRQWGESNFNPDTKANRSGRVNIGPSRNITVDDLEKILFTTGSGVTLTLVDLGADNIGVPLVINTFNFAMTLQAGSGIDIRWLQGGSFVNKGSYTIARYSMVTLIQVNSSTWDIAGNGIS